MLSASSTRQNRRGERGSPCLTPLLQEKYPCCVPLVETEIIAELRMANIQLQKILLNPKP